MFYYHHPIQITCICAEATMNNELGFHLIVVPTLLLATAVLSFCALMVW
jgi:hypothetical protein